MLGVCFLTKGSSEFESKSLNSHKSNEDVFTPGTAVNSNLVEVRGDSDLTD